MNKVLITLIGAVVLGATAPAMAAQDIFQLQATDRVHMAKRERNAAFVGTSAPERCTAQLFLPLDHGPRATSTPYLNQLRKDRFAAEAKVCREAVS